MQNSQAYKNLEIDDFETKIEFQIILGNAKNLSFESALELMIELYKTVFQTDSPLIQKAARLRTFLYQYKASVLKISPELTTEDQIVMLEIARTSKELLNSIEEI